MTIIADEFNFKKWNNCKSLLINDPGTIRSWLRHALQVDNKIMATEAMNMLGTPTDLSYKERLTYYELMNKD